MAKISKNIKRLRNEKGITQDLLAEKLHITRQAVSSWENDRTQPDVDMLEKLSEVFGVSIEELIYGKKRNTALELEKTNYISTVTIVFSILGSLLVGVGLVLIFVTFWKDVPLLFKGILSFVPLLAGQASGLFVLHKKKTKVAWCEGGSVLWTAGIAATLTLIYNIFDLSVNWTSIFLLVSLSVLPVIVLLRSVAPTVIYYAAAIAWGFINVQEYDNYTALYICAVLVALGCVFTTYLIKEEKKSHRSIASQWISVIAVTVFIVLVGVGLADDFAFGFVGLMAVSVCLYIFSFKDGDMAMPYRLPGLLGISIVMFISATFYMGYVDIGAYNIIYTVICVFAVLASAYVTRLKGADKASLTYIGLAAVFFVIQIASLYSMPDGYKENVAEGFVAILKIPAFAAYITMMISGAREKKLLPINLGFIGVSALAMVVVAQSGLSMLGNGILLLILGGVLLAINFKISKAKQQTPVSENNGEVSSDEK